MPFAHENLIHNKGVTTTQWGKECIAQQMVLGELTHYEEKENPVWYMGPGWKMPFSPLKLAEWFQDE